MKYFNILFIVVGIVCSSFFAKADSCRKLFKKSQLSSKNVVKSNFPPDFKLPILNPSEVSINQFRKAFNRGEFKGDEKFITFMFKESEIFSDYKISIYPITFKIFGKVISINQNTIEVEWLDRWVERKKILSFEELISVEVNEKSKDFFKQSLQFSKSVGPFKIQKSTEFSKLKEQGFKNRYIRGIDEINEFLELGKKLRESNVHPYKTHIVDLAYQAPQHINFIREGILAQGMEVKERLEILENFSKEAENKINKKQLTYAYWLIWNKRLSILATPTSERSNDHDLIISPEETIHINELGNWWKTYKNEYTERNEIRKNFFQINSIIGRFPHLILLPTIVDIIGVMAFNKTAGTGISPIGLINKNNKTQSPYSELYGPLEEYEPSQFFNHDIDHAFMDIYDHQNKFFNLNKLLQSSTKPLSTAERQIAEAIFFRMTHEQLNYKHIETIYDIKSHILELKSEIRKNIFHFLVNPRLLDTNEKINKDFIMKQLNNFVDLSMESLENEKNWSKEIEEQKRINQRRKQLEIDALIGKEMDFHWHGINYDSLRELWGEDYADKFWSEENKHIFF